MADDILQKLRRTNGSVGDRHSWPANPDGEDAAAEISRLRAKVASAYDRGQREAFERAAAFVEANQIGNGGERGKYFAPRMEGSIEGIEGIEYARGIRALPVLPYGKK